MFSQGKKVIAGLAALGALALGGAALASAASSGSGAGTSQTAPSHQAPPAFRGPAHGTAAHENAEKPVTGEAAAKAQAAAVKLVGSGTAGAVTTDLPGTGYEVTVTKSDGSKIEVHLDSSFQALRAPWSHGMPPAGQNGQPPAGQYGPPPGQGAQGRGAPPPGA